MAYVTGAHEINTRDAIDVTWDFRKGSVDLGQFTKEAESSGTVTVDSTYGVKLLTTDTDKETAIYTPFLFGITAHTARPSYLKAEAICLLARNADLDMGMTFGFTTGSLGDLLVDTTSAVCASFDGAVFTLAHDSLALGTTVSNAAVQSSTTSEATLVETSWFKLGVEIVDVYSRDGGTTFYALSLIHI
jgi:hypothetical protein